VKCIPESVDDVLHRCEWNIRMPESMNDVLHPSEWEMSFLSIMHVVLNLVHLCKWSNISSQTACCCYCWWCWFWSMSIGCYCLCNPWSSTSPYNFNWTDMLVLIVLAREIDPRNSTITIVFSQRRAIAFRAKQQRILAFMEGNRPFFSTKQQRWNNP